MPVATYRLQFNQHFTFRDAARLVPYLEALGISDLYASPYLQARPGSLHGYDISDHSSLNAEIGSAEDHAALTATLRKHGMGHLLDIVPNHMGVGGDSNRWWMDVLENGPSSPFAAFFDIDFFPLRPGLAGKVLLPVLTDQFGVVLERGELRLRFQDGRFQIAYFDTRYPVAPRSSALVLREALQQTRLAADDVHRMELESIVAALENLPPRDRAEPAAAAERRREKAVTQRRLSLLASQSPEVERALGAAVRLFNGVPGEPATFDRLETLLDDQAYRLAFWRVAAEEINYRRFFDVNDLAGLRVQRPEVFEATHRLILDLVRQGLVTGLRIDHPDGLYDPPAYLQQLQEEISGDGATSPSRALYLLVEKILTGDEQLPAEWPVAGTVGYEFLNLLNGLFVAPEAEPAMDEAYARFVGRVPDFADLVYDRKKLILRVGLASELNVLAHLLDRLSEKNRRVRDFTLGSLSNALREMIACFPVYRTYINAHLGRVDERDRAYVEQAARAAQRRNPSTSASVYHFLRDVLLLRWPAQLADEERAEHARFVMKFQQLTGPVMAKGVEDTAFYIYNRLASLNEVGGEPDRFGVQPEQFHAEIAQRAAAWPHAMNTTSTHDTKRSEDVRARINVLSELPTEWAEHALRWAELNRDHKTMLEGRPAPDANDEYLLYQTLIGAWPLEHSGSGTDDAFVARIQQYMEKATREAKVHTSWINPDAEYDAALRGFVAAILRAEADNAFLRDFVPLQQRIAPLGALNSLAQTLLKLTCSGVPDVYQGQELWDFSLVDPDNRQPVDYERRRQLLSELAERSGSPAERAALAASLRSHWRDGRIKLYVTRAALHLRQQHAELFRDGAFEPLGTAGRMDRHVFGFQRRLNNTAVVVAVPRFCGALLRPDVLLPDFRHAPETRLVGPADQLRGAYRSRFTGATVQASTEGDGTAALFARDLFADFPVALLERV